MLKFSPANSKIKKLVSKKRLKKWHQDDVKRIWSLDLLSGYSCPFAMNCLAKVVEKNGKRTVQDGPNTEFRCFSASNEALYPATYNLRKSNFDLIRGKSKKEIINLIEESMPSNAGIIRWHCGGDITSENHFKALCSVAENHTDTLFYAYTKALPYWIKNQHLIPSNFKITASRGGRRDDLIDEYGLNEARVVYSQYEARQLGLPIDNDDSHAAYGEGSFALMIHGQNPKGSKAVKAVNRIRKNKLKYVQAA